MSLHCRNFNQNILLKGFLFVNPRPSYVYGLIIWRFALTLEPWLILSVLGAQEWLKKSVVG